MSFISLLLAAGSFMSTSLAAPVQPIFLVDASNHLLKRADAYKMYAGKADNVAWPKSSQWWSSYDAMFKANMKIIREGCGQYHVPLNTNQEIIDLDQSIRQVASESNVDARFILAVVLEESSACVRAPTSNYGVRNPGLMQSHNGAGTCNDGGVKTPCPSDTILRMVRDGVKGTSHGDGLAQLLHRASGSQDGKYYQAARMYNSGSLHASGDLEKGIASHCYVSDVANRLTGWVRSQKGCTLDGAPPPALGGHDGGDDFISAADTLERVPVPAPAAASIPETAPIVAPAPPPAPAPVAAQESLPKSAPIAAARVQASQVFAPAQPQAAKANRLAPGATTKCAKYYNVQEGDFCLKMAEKFGISFARLRELNTAVDSQCSNLWLGYDYCIEGL